MQALAEKPVLKRLLNSWVLTYISPLKFDDEVNGLHAMAQAVIGAVKFSGAYRTLEDKLQLPFRETIHYAKPPRLRLTWRSYRSVNVVAIKSGSMFWKLDAVLQTTPSSSLSSLR